MFHMTLHYLFCCQFVIIVINISIIIASFLKYYKLVPY